MDRAFTHLMEELAAQRLRSPERTDCDSHAKAVMQRVDMACTAAGFAPPPCLVHIRFEQDPDGWRLSIVAPPGRPRDVARWLEPYRPDEVQIEDGLGPKVLTVRFRRLPVPWQRFLATVAVHCVEMTPEGTASFFTDRAGDRMRAVVRDGPDAPEAPVVRVRGAMTGSEARPGAAPTRRQQEVMALAAALGYYDVPRRLNLRDLAERVDLSPAATSELLRRGERAVILGCVDAWAARACSVAGKAG